MTRSIIESSFLLNGTAAEVHRRYLDADTASANLPARYRMYYRLRPIIPLRLRQWLQRQRNASVHVPSDWYLPTHFMRELKRCPELSASDFNPWPDGARFAFVLSHDVETEAGLRLIPEIASIEEELGFRSSWNIVPYKYAIDRGLLEDLRQRGFEVGVHGFNHDGKLFWSRRVFHERSVAINRALGEYQAVGFRSPMVHRKLEWIHDDLDIQYDASCFDVDPFQAMPGGIGSIWPFRFGKIVELPYTMPQDHTLMVTLGETTDRIWRRKLTFIRQYRGMALMLTHPDYLDSQPRRDIYRSLLSWVRDVGDYWHVLPRQMASWCREQR